MVHARSRQRSTVASVTPLGNTQRSVGVWLVTRDVESGAMGRGQGTVAAASSIALSLLVPASFPPASAFASAPLLPSRAPSIAPSDAASTSDSCPALCRRRPSARNKKRKSRTAVDAASSHSLSVKLVTFGNPAGAREAPSITCPSQVVARRRPTMGLKVVSAEASGSVYPPSPASVGADASGEASALASSAPSAGDASVVATGFSVQIVLHARTGSPPLGHVQPFGPQIDPP